MVTTAKKQATSHTAREGNNKQNGKTTNTPKKRVFVTLANIFEIDIFYTYIDTQVQALLRKGVCGV